MVGGRRVGSLSHEKKAGKASYLSGKVFIPGRKKRRFVSKLETCRKVVLSPGGESRFAICPPRKRRAFVVKERRGVPRKLWGRDEKAASRPKIFLPHVRKGGAHTEGKRRKGALASKNSLKKSRKKKGRTSQKERGLEEKEKGKT